MLTASSLLDDVIVDILEFGEEVLLTFGEGMLARFLAVGVTVIPRWVRMSATSLGFF